MVITGMVLGQTEGPEPTIFIKVTNEDVWSKLIELEKKVDRLNTRIYAFAGALTIVGGVLGITGGITFG